MEEETKNKLDELFPGWEPVPIEEEDDIDFGKAVRGKYDVEIISIEHKVVTTKDGEKDIIEFKLKAVNDVSGDKSFNRHFNKSFWMGASQWDVDPDYGLKQMVNSLVSMGVNFDIPSKTDFGLIAGGLNGGLVGQTVRIRAYPNKDTGKQVVVFIKPKDDEEKTEESLGNPFLK